MKHYLKLIPAVLLIAYLVLLSALLLTGHYKPPHSRAFGRLKREVYAEYLRIGDMPGNLDFLSAESKALLAEPNGISAAWNETEKSLHYEYDKPYEVNVSLQTILTFGLVPTGDKALGEGVGEKAIRNNAPLYRDAGRLR